MPADIFNAMTVQHPLIIVGGDFVFAFLWGRDFKHALIQALAMMLLLLALASHWL